MITVAVIGIGNLGKRHLQSIVEVFTSDAEIYAVDVNDEALKTISDIYAGKVKCLSDINGLPKIIDAVVVATNSNVRRKIVEGLLTNITVKNMILEKVLFQKEKDYFVIDELIKKCNVNTWVNCARRSWDSYQAIKNIFDTDKELYIDISGGEWGLGCNCIHMLDLIQFLTKSEECTVNVSKLEPGLAESKRKGYFEFYGVVQGTCGKCRDYKIRCLRNTNVPVLIEMLSENRRVVIDESHKSISVCSRESGWTWEVKEFPSQYQSQLTGKVISEIINSGESPLTTYTESMKLHISFIRPLIDFFNKEGLEGKTCPIT